MLAGQLFLPSLDGRGHVECWVPKSVVSITMESGKGSLAKK